MGKVRISLWAMCMVCWTGIAWGGILEDLAGAGRNVLADLSRATQQLGSKVQQTVQGILPKPTPRTAPICQLQRLPVPVVGAEVRTLVGTFGVDTGAGKVIAGPPGTPVYGIVERNPRSGVEQTGVGIVLGGLRADVPVVGKVQIGANLEFIFSPGNRSDAGRLSLDGGVGVQGAGVTFIPASLEAEFDLNSGVLKAEVVVDPELEIGKGKQGRKEESISVGAELVRVIGVELDVYKTIDELFKAAIPVVSGSETGGVEADSLAGHSR